MLTIKYTSKMKRDVRRIVRRGKDIAKLSAALDLLATGNQMPHQYKDHTLKGGMSGLS